MAQQQQLQQLQLQQQNNYNQFQQPFPADWSNHFAKALYTLQAISAQPKSNDTAQEQERMAMFHRQFTKGLSNNFNDDKGDGPSPSKKSLVESNNSKLDFEKVFSGNRKSVVPPLDNDENEHEDSGVSLKLYKNIFLQ